MKTTQMSELEDNEIDKWDGHWTLDGQRIMRRNRRNWNRTMDLAELLAVIFAAVLLLKYTESCQQVDIFSHSSTLCEASDRGTICNVRLSEVLKLSAFKKEACLKLLRGNASIHEIRVEWKTLSLLCEPVTMLFTRHTSYHVDSSKRCPHTGSCTGQKCTGINTSAIISELERETIILASLSLGVSFTVFTWHPNPHKFMKYLNVIDGPKQLKSSSLIMAEEQATYVEGDYGYLLK
ncbi:unnamed protein product [Heligmosomoides polygyrus]|uniref:Phlebovirus_G2 domain-containing protein n=1 Tax=Heligmosomoides polygyrus TaxID=6339 RepID=A0A3P7ZJQ5_HELPZ|nr:unnamed protein product [Heligmosomoides polygyrus]